MYVDVLDSTVGAEKRINIPYDENIINISFGLQFLSKLWAGIA
jgi:hypothetical protein